MYKTLCALSWVFLALGLSAHAESNPYPNISCGVTFEDKTYVQMTPSIPSDQTTPEVDFSVVQGNVRVNIRVFAQFQAPAGSQPYCHFFIGDSVRGIGLESMGLFDPTNVAGLGGYACNAGLVTNMPNNKWVEVGCLNNSSTIRKAKH